MSLSPAVPYLENQNPDVVALLERSGYVHSPRCAVCRSLHPVTKIPVRTDIEELVAKAGTSQALNFMKGLGIDVTIRTLQRHIQAHAPYLKGGFYLQRQKEFIQKAIEEHSDADTAIQNIVNIGNKMIGSGELPVSEKMYLEALKLKQKDKQVSSLAGFLKTVEQSAFIEGEIVEDKKLHPGGKENLGGLAILKKKQGPSATPSQDTNSTSETAPLTNELPQSEVETSQDTESSPESILEPQNVESSEASN